MDNVNSGRGQAPKGGGAGGPRKKKKKGRAGRIIGRIFLVLFTLCVIGVLTAAIFFKIFMTYVNTSLVPTLDVTVEQLTMSEASTIYYQDNATGEWKVLDTLFSSNGNRKIVEYSDLPKHLVDAVVAIEDKRFWDHKGVDWEGTAAAIFKTFTTGTTRGGSTITQQMLRNVTEDNEVTVKRKVREIFRALEFEKSHSKEDILTLYLNYVYFGNGYDGIQTAAEGYFGKDVSELSLAESACIIGITNNPSLYDPFRKAEFKQDDGTVMTCRDFNKRRQEVILKAMLDQEIISEEEYEAAKAEKLLFTDTEEYKALHSGDSGQEVEDTSSVYSWFTDAVIDDAITLIAEANGCSEDMATTLLFSAGYHIYTTLDMDIQKIVDSIYTDPSNFDYPSPTGKPLDSAITITDPYTGDVVAMAGGVGEKTTSRSLNLATSPRTCGSAIKPVAVYAPAIENNVVSPATVIDEYPIRLNDAGTGGWPKNDNNKYDGYMTVADGLRRSRNTVATRVLEKLGTATSFYFMEDNLGFDLDPRDNALAPLAMGGLTYGVTTEEMAAAFAAFANSGIYTKPRTITEIRAADNKEVIVDNSSRSTPAMKESTAYLMNKMLRSVVTNGTGGGANFSGMTIAGKTGTTSNNFDRYFAGYTPYYSAAVWVGYAESPERIRADINPAAKIWRLVMQPIHEGLENKSFPEKPSGIVSVQVCADCGLKPSALCASDYRGSRVISMEVQEGAVPTETCTCHVEVQICTDPATGTIHLAGPYCPEETVTTRVMLQGREFLLVPYASPVTNEDGSVSTGWPILAGDSDAHMSYLQLQGNCPIHDENYVPEPEPVPGDPNYQWPEGTEPSDWWPWQDPEGEGDGGDDPGHTTTPSEPDDPEEGGGEGGSTAPEEPDEPSLPSEP